MNNIVFVGEHTLVHDVRWHMHEQWELVYCTSGSGVLHLKTGIQIAYAAGDMVALPPRVAHCNCSEAGFTNIHINIDNPTFPYHHAFCVRDREGALGAAFRQAHMYYVGDVKMRELILSALGDLIIGYIVVFRSNGQLSRPVEQILSSMLQNYTRVDYNLEAVIRQQPFNYDYLRKLFKQEIGVPPFEYLNTMRMKTAEKLLASMRNHEHSITQVAMMCGFSDPLYFSRTFKKYYGVSPRAYLKQLAERQDERHDRIELTGSGEAPAESGKVSTKKDS